MIAIVELVCERCGTTATREASDLFVQIDAETDSSGSLIFDCATCQDRSTIEVDLRTVATLLLAGAHHLCRLPTEDASQTDVSLERGFTAEDALAWQEALRTVTSVDPWE